jgi:GNAT superfamily N-acetyltransferase
VSKESFTVRRATVEDAEAIGKIHKASWLTTYRGLIHQGFLDSIDVQKRTEAARLRAIDDSLDCLVLVENFEDAIIGFADVGRSRDRDIAADGELYAIYLLQEKQGKGGGRLLFENALRAARERGFSKMMVSVLENNQPSRKFYEGMGGQFVDSHTRVIDSHSYPSVRYVWFLD